MYKTPFWKIANTGSFNRIRRYMSLQINNLDCNVAKDFCKYIPSVRVCHTTANQVGVTC